MNVIDAMIALKGAVISGFLKLPPTRSLCLEDPGGPALVAFPSDCLPSNISR